MAANRFTSVGWPISFKTQIFPSWFIVFDAPLSRTHFDTGHPT